jgi:hypothetical protein
VLVEVLGAVVDTADVAPVKIVRSWAEGLWGLDDAAGSVHRCRRNRKKTMRIPFDGVALGMYNFALAL